MGKPGHVHGSFSAKPGMPTQIADHERSGGYSRGIAKAISSLKWVSLSPTPYFIRILNTSEQNGERVFHGFLDGVSVPHAFIPLFSFLLLLAGGQMV